MKRRSVLTLLGALLGGTSLSSAKVISQPQPRVSTPSEFPFRITKGETGSFLKEGQIDHASLVEFIYLKMVATKKTGTLTFDLNLNSQNVGHEVKRTSCFVDGSWIYLDLQKPLEGLLSECHWSIIGFSKVDPMRVGSDKSIGLCQQSHLCVSASTHSWIGAPDLNRTVSSTSDSFGYVIDAPDVVWDIIRAFKDVCAFLEKKSGGMS